LSLSRYFYYRRNHGRLLDSRLNSEDNGISPCVFNFRLSRRIPVARVAALGVALIFCVISSSAQIFSPLHTLTAASAFAAPLTQGPDGMLYGVSSGGGLGGAGTVFRLSPDGTHFAV